MAMRQRLSNLRYASNPNLKSRLLPTCQLLCYRLDMVATLVEPRFLVASLLALAAITSTTPCHAQRTDSLAELAKQVSRATKHQEAQNRKELLGARWFVAGSNFAKVFIDKKGPLIALDWLGTIIHDFSAGKDGAIRKVEYVRGDRVFTDEKFKRVVVTILVPHPKYASIVDLGLIEVFSSIEPPRLHVVAEHPLSIKGAKSATLYQNEKGDYSIVVKLPRNAVVNITSTERGMRERLQGFAQGLDFERLAQKLMS